jgi:hypothetical protein
MSAANTAAQTKVIAAVTEYEDKALELLVKVQDEVIQYVKQAVELIDGRVSDIELPFEVPQVELLDEIPTLAEIVDTQFAFSKKLLASQEKFAKNVVKAVKPLTREATTKATAKTTANKTAA